VTVVACAGTGVQAFMVALTARGGVLAVAQLIVGVILAVASILGAWQTWVHRLRRRLIAIQATGQTAV
jgi:hypothetical protein